MRNAGVFVVFLLALTEAGAQSTAPPPAAASRAPVISPEVLPDHRVVFRLKAPQATEVTIAGDFWTQQNRTEKLTKGEDGVWSLTTDPLPANEYSYFYILDGVPIPDPMDGEIKPGIRATQSAFLVPGPDAEFLEETSVPHGEVRVVYYRSTVVGKVRRMHIYFPPGYDKSKTRYPVVYLFHGGGDNDWGWFTVGRVNFILDNLIAQGKAKPMIVVMPSLYMLDPPVSADRMEENEALFEKSLIQDVIPYAESNYRVLPGVANRAVGELGTGRNMLPDVLWNTLDNFGSVVFVSGGAGPERFALLQREHPGVIDNPANIKHVKFFLGDGANDGSVEDSRYLARQLKSLGYNVTTYETDGTHGWPSFRRCFAKFAQTAFRQEPGTE